MSTTIGAAREGLDREQQQILAELEEKRAAYEPLERKASQAVARQMRVYHEIRELEDRLTRINEAIKVLG